MEELRDLMSATSLTTTSIDELVVHLPTYAAWSQKMTLLPNAQALTQIQPIVELLHTFGILAGIEFLDPPLAEKHSGRRTKAKNIQS